MVRRSKNTSRHQKRKRLYAESLEPRIVLDGGGFDPEGILPFVLPDSNPGEDPHVAVVGPDATPIDFAGDYAVIDSYLDEAGDVDVFQFEANGVSVQVAGNIENDEVEPDVHVFNSNGEELAPVESLIDDPGGFIRCDVGSFEFCDLFPTEPDETYFISVGGKHKSNLDVGVPGDTASEYRFLIMNPVPAIVATSGNPDSPQGEDSHADTRSRSATELVFTGGNSRVDSYIDTPGDVDVFRFNATSETISLNVEAFDRTWSVLVGVWDVHGNLIAHNRGALTANGDNAVRPVIESNQLEPGRHYFVTVSAMNGVHVGEYLLNVFHEAPRVPQGPDSGPGNDFHGDEIGGQATNLQFEFGNGLSHAKVHSFMDTARDVDMFRFVADGNWLSASAFSPGNSVSLSLNLYNPAGDLLATSDLDRFMLPADEIFNPQIEAELEIDFEYYLAISSYDGRAGEYVMHAEQFGSIAPPPNIGNADSRRGDDPHADRIGPEATPLVHYVNDAGQRFATVDSFIDHADDIDAFRFVAVGSRVHVAAHAWNQELDFSISVFDANRNLVATSKVDGDNQFSNLVMPVRSGRGYFLAVQGENGTSGEYVVNLHQAVSNVDVTPNHVADSDLGSDPHVDTPGPNATNLAMGDGAAHVLSYIDRPSDVDVFQLVGSGGYALASSNIINMVHPLQLTVLNAAGGEVPSLATFDFLPSNLGLQFWETIAGETYYVVVTNPRAALYQLDVFAESLSDMGGPDVQGKLDEIMAALPDVSNVNDRNGHRGDANFDGSIDAIDFSAWYEHRFGVAAGPAEGDFNEDGVVDVGDFNIWNDFRFTASPNQIRAERNQIAAPAGSRAPQALADATVSHAGDTVSHTAVSRPVVQALALSSVARRQLRSRPWQFIGSELATEKTETFNVSSESLLRRVPRLWLNTATAATKEATPSTSMPAKAADRVFAELGGVAEMNNL